MLRGVSLALIIAVAAFEMVGAGTQEAQYDSIQLLKKEEFYLREGSELGAGLAPHYTSNLVVSSEGFVIVESGDRIHYFYDEHNLVKTVGGGGIEAGCFPYGCIWITLSDSNEVVAVGYRRRINIYDDKGNALKSIFVPDFGFSPTSAQKHRNFLILGGLHWDQRPRIMVYDYETCTKIGEFFAMERDDYDILIQKNADVFFEGPFFVVSPEGHVFCNRMYDHRVFEYTLSGELLHVYEEVPPHYVGLDAVEPGPSTEELTNSPESASEWEASWSYSGYPSLYHRDMFVVPRRLAPPYYLDFYSISERRYLGYCDLGSKAFAFSDSNYIYLYEHFSDTLLVIGKYVALVGGTTKEPPREETATHFLSKKTIEAILDEVLHEPSETTMESVADLKVVGLDGREKLLRECLSGASRHFVIFVRLFFDCPFLPMYEPVRDFCKENKDYDLYVVVTHPYKEELECVIKGLKLEATVIPNLRGSAVKGVAPSYPYPGIILLNKDGSKILATCSTVDLFRSVNPLTIEEFFREVTSIGKE